MDTNEEAGMRLSLISVTGGSVGFAQGKDLFDAISAAVFRKAVMT
jgi:hypothetical protein